MTKVIVEIDGERHRLVEDDNDIDCVNCSLRTFCLEGEDVICNSFGEGYHFEKEDEQ